MTSFSRIVPSPLAPASGGTSGSFDGTCADFAALPDAATHAGQIWLVRSHQGIAFINRKKRGAYKSDGTAWNYLASFTASQIDYDATDSSLTASNVKDALDQLSHQMTASETGSPYFDGSAHLYVVYGIDDDWQVDKWNGSSLAQTAAHQPGPKPATLETIKSLTFL